MATAATLTPEQIRRRSLQSGTIGAIVEWYEYTIYGVAAALVFGHLFFPDLAPGIGQIVSLATFGVGFPARPIGAFVAGHLGDRIGRKSTLILTLSITTVATAAIGTRRREPLRARVAAAERTLAPVTHPATARSRTGTPRPEARYCAGRDAAMMCP
ncbi:hypothetical protein AB0L35_10390 [Streptomyces sp. NPDC052309]|uniref:hypothetical protein n=1 Tax=Streptomyces sp. NPDC052309 TaxID=3155421 RepID=UPI003424ADE3